MGEFVIDKFKDKNAVARWLAGQAASWSDTVRDFNSFHASGWNNIGHLLTTPLGIVSTFGFIAVFSAPLMLGIATLWSVTLFLMLPLTLGLVVVGSLGAMAAIAVFADLPWYLWFIGIVAGYGLQDLAHWMTRESTFESSYKKDEGAWREAVRHTFLLLPLVYQAAWDGRMDIAGAIAPKKRGLTVTLTNSEEKQDIEAVRAWVLANIEERETTTHKWFHEMGEDVQAACERLAASDTIKQMFTDHHGSSTEVDIIADMNELYVTGPDRKGSSDNVFYKSHVDGPYGFIPFATVYRGMLGITPNMQVRTHIPTERQDGDHSVHMVQENEVLMFDYHRTPHYITQTGEELPDDAPPRVNLKLHYLVYPFWAKPLAKWLGRRSAAYNTNARNNFLATLTPKSWIEILWARYILAMTDLGDWATKNIGGQNFTYLAFLALLSIASGSILPLLLGAGFIHYCLYMATYYRRTDISFGSFKRDSFIFKTVSLTMLFGLYATYATGNWFSMAIAAAGFGLSMFATWRLGVDRTYFGTELGVLEPKRISVFPFGVIPHPMIVGQMIGMVGLNLDAGFREAFPWLIPLHVGLYMLVLLQEHFDVTTKKMPVTQS